MTIRLRSSARTSTGQVRENNEDNIHLWTGDDFVLAIVADGMGGAAAGEEASRIAVETVKNGFTGPLDVLDVSEDTEPDDVPITERLLGAIQLANYNIVKKASSSPEMRGMGTTITLAYVRGTYATIAHVGDSRAYFLDGDDHTITQITSDHSFVQALVTAGHLLPEQAEGHPMGNVLYRALGQSEEVEVDLYYKRLHLGDWMILCSDGLTRHVRAEEMASLTFTHQEPDIVSQALIDLANERGGEDNVSVIVIAIDGELPIAQSPFEKLFSGDKEDTIVLTRSMLQKMDTQENPAIHNNHADDASSPSAESRLEPSKMSAERLKDEEASIFSSPTKKVKAPDMAVSAVSEPEFEQGEGVDLRESEE